MKNVEPKAMARVAFERTLGSLNAAFVIFLPCFRLLVRCDREVFSCCMTVSASVVLEPVGDGSSASSSIGIVVGCAAPYHDLWALSGSTLGAALIAASISDLVDDLGRIALTVVGVGTVLASRMEFRVKRNLSGFGDTAFGRGGLLEYIDEPPRKEDKLKRMLKGERWEFRVEVTGGRS